MITSLSYIAAPSFSSSKSFYNISYMFNATGALASHSAQFGAGRGPVVFDDVHCTGNETSLFECSALSHGVHNCDNTEDAGVTCKGKRYPFFLLGEAHSLWIRSQVDVLFQLHVICMILGYNNYHS